jgi:ubiquinone/menaquinone biosynthesis C-methylase UbiE
MAMVTPRTIETGEGIQDANDVRHYNQMQRRFRDKGWLETKIILKSGITSGHALEIGPGPGYLGLEWLKNSSGTRLTGLEISPAMITVAEQNAKDYQLSSRVTYVLGSGDKIPFEDESMDGVFTNGSLHEWSNPPATFREINRVLKPGGRVFISDLKRNVKIFVKAFLWLATKPPEIRPGLITSLKAAYTADEVRRMLDDPAFIDWSVSDNLLGLRVVGIK